MAEAKTEEMGVKKILGTVVLVKKKNVLDFDSHHSAILDSVHEVFGRKVSVQLISAKNADPANKLFFWGPKVRGKLGKPVHLKNWLTTHSTGGESKFEVCFDWDEEIDVPGAFLIKNHHHSEFYLKSVTLVPQGIENQGPIHFVCNSWVYPNSCYKKDRIFFFNKPFLPCDTPLPLQKYREEELLSLRGDGKAKLEEWDRVYDYAIYNDLGDPDKGPEYVRPILGGSTQYPYPRRGRTGRPPSKADPKTEGRLSIFKSLSIYVPRDERFSNLKMSDFLAFGLKSIAPVVKAELTGLDYTPDEFGCFQDVLKIYRECDTTTVSRSDLLDSIGENNSSEVFRELFRTEGEGHSKLPMPQVIKEDNSAWRSDEEFGREMLAGLNPLVIQRLQVFPPVSQSDPKKTSSITKEHIEMNMDGLTVDEAMKNNRLFILDHYDALMPYLGRINSETSTKTYATRTILFLKEDGTLNPLAIELSLPDKSEVYTPAENGIKGHLWQLAKAYVAVNDSGHHQLISHWLRTHATMEPFIIATNRQLSVLHPIHKLLYPHFRDTMTVNALSRQILINAGGLLEMTVFPCKFSLEISSQVYKNWVFTEQALPEDLIKRGVAVRDDKAPHGVTLLIKDYPYAVDGLEIWSAIKTWVQDYCLLYYNNDEMVQEDPELKSWWKEVREKGHGDKKHEPWWPKMQTREELIETCSTIIWVASALHAAVNFGQYPYGGYLPNRPSISRKLMPDKETLETELENHPDHEAYFQKDFLRTITAQFQTLLGISLIEVLSKHTSDEVYLGQRDSPEWTCDAETLKAFEKFGNNLRKIEEKITSLNADESLKNRAGPVKMPYTLLYPSSEIGLTGKGIPNSVSI